MVDGCGLSAVKSIRLGDAPSGCGRGGHDSLITVDNAERPCAVGCVHLGAVIGGVGALLWEADKRTMVVLVSEGTTGACICAGEEMLSMVALQPCCHVV